MAAIGHDTDVIPAGGTATEWRVLTDRLTRRKLITSSAAAVLLATIGDDSRAQEASPTTTREIADRMGPVTVPAHPQRVIADSNTTLGNMAALGVKPIGTGVNTLSLPRYLGDWMEGIADVTSEENYLDLEKALALEPDLIIAIWGSGGEGWNVENCELYKQAVATFCYEQNYVYEEDLKANIRQIALALSVEAKADDVLAEYDQRVAEMRQKVVETGFDSKPVSVVRIRQDGTYSIRVGTSESIIFRAIGIPQPEGQQNPEDFAIDLSLENLDLLNQAFAVVIYIDDNGETTQDDIFGNDLWRFLTPVRESRVVFVSSGVWNSIDMLGALAIIDDVESLLLPLATEG